MVIGDPFVWLGLGPAFSASVRKRTRGDCSYTVPGAPMGDHPRSLPDGSGLATRFRLGRGCGSELFIVPDAASLPALATVRTSAPLRAPNHPKERRPVHHDAHDDLHLLADRLRLGVPLHGFDGREIPLRDAFGAPVAAAPGGPRAARLGRRLLLDPDQATEFMDDTLARAREVETAGVHGRRSTGSGSPPGSPRSWSAPSVRASLLSQSRHVSPSEINRATLSWYEMSQLQRRPLLDAEIASRSRRASTPEPSPAPLGARRPLSRT